jgi:TolA-binding protein
LIKSTGGKSVLAILVSVLLLTTALPRAARSQVSEANKQKVARKVAKDWIQVGATQYKRGFYKAAEQSLLRAQDWQGYLTAGERGKLNELLEKAHLSALERARISGHIQKADELAKKGELIRARANLETVRYSKFLTKEEERLIAERVNEISNQISEQRRRSTEIYNRSVEFYRTGQLERAREGFLEVIKKGLLVALPQITAAEYLVRRRQLP